MKGGYSVIKGPLKDNAGNEVVAAGAAYVGDGDRAREHGLSRRRRDRLDILIPSGGCRGSGDRPDGGRGTALSRHGSRRSANGWRGDRRRSSSRSSPSSPASLCSDCLSLALGKSPVEFYELMYKGGFGTWFSVQNTLQRASPLLLAALCVALPARLGLVIIGGEGAIVLGGLAAARSRSAADGFAPAIIVLPLMAAAAASRRRHLDRSVGALRQYRGVNETIASLLMAYIAIALMNQLVEGPLRDPASLNKPSTTRSTRRSGSATSRAWTCTGASSPASSAASSPGS